MEIVGAVINVQSDMCYIQNMETVGAVINIQSDMCVYTEYGDGRSGYLYTVGYVYIYRIWRR